MSRAANRPSRRQVEASRRAQAPGKVPFSDIAAAAIPHLPVIVSRWLPNGRRRGNEWIALNPKRSDGSPGSFSVNLNTGRWADFACGVAGGDVISLAAYLHDLRQVEAASKVSTMLGLGGR